jgi:cytochrome P450
MESYAPAVRRMANELIDGFVEKGQCEFVSDFTAHLPGMVFFECVMGVPVEDLPELFSNIDKGTFGPLAERPTHFVKVMTYLEDYLKLRSEQPPRGDVVDVVLAGVDKDGAPCPWEDKVAIILDLVFGGLATTTHVMTAAAHYLATHDADRRALVADPDLVTTAVEEFVRMLPPVVAPARCVTKDTELGGVALAAGDWIVLNYAASSRDPAVTERADVLDIRRQDIVHSAFGVGPHRCLGSNLARLELRVTVEEMLRRIPEFRVVAGTEPSFETSQLRTMTSLHLEFP